MFSNTAKTMKIFSYTIFFLLFIAGCQENTPVPTSIAEIQDTAIVSAIATETATEIPPSSTPTKTHTPTAIPTSTAVPTSTPTSTPSPTPPVIDVANADKLTRASSWGDGGIFNQIAWSPDSQQLLLVADEIRYLDLQTLDILNIVSPVGASGAAEFNTAASILAGGNSGTIEIWDLETASLRFSLEGHKEYGDKALSPDGQLLAAIGENDDSVRLWDVNTGELRYEITEIPFPSEFDEPNEFTKLIYPKVDISPDSKSLVIGVSSSTYLPEKNSNHDNSNIQIFDLQTGTFQRVLEEYRNGRISDVTFSPDGQIVGIVHEIRRSHMTEFRDFATGDLVDTVSVGLVADVAFAPNMSMVGVSHDGGITLRNIYSKETVGVLEVPQRAHNIVFSPDSTKIAAKGSGWVRIWDVETQEILHIEQPDSIFSARGLHSINHQVVGVQPDTPSNIELRDLQTGQIIQTLTDSTADERYTNCLVFSPDNQYLARCIQGSDIGLIEMWDVVNGDLMYTINLPSQNWARYMSFHPDGETFAVSVGSSVMMSYDVTTGQLLENINFATDSSPKVRRFTYSPDGRFIAAQGGVLDGNQSLPDVLIFDSASRLQIASIPTGDKTYSSPPFLWHPVKPIIAIGGRDGTIQLVDVTTGERVQEMHKQGRIYDLLFNPNGMILVSVSVGEVTMWDPETGDMIHTLTNTGGPKFTSDGRTLMTLGGNKVYSWQVR